MALWRGGSARTGDNRILMLPRLLGRLTSAPINFHVRAIGAADTKLVQFGRFNLFAEAQARTQRRRLNSIQATCSLANQSDCVTNTISVRAPEFDRATLKRWLAM